MSRWRGRRELSDEGPRRRQRQDRRSRHRDPCKCFTLTRPIGGKLMANASIRIQYQWSPPGRRFRAPIRVGNVPPGDATPQCYVLVEEPGDTSGANRRLRETGTRRGVCVRGGDRLGRLGCDRVWRAGTSGEAPRRPKIDPRIGKLLRSLVSTGILPVGRVVRTPIWLQPDARLAWTSDIVRIDGVVVEGIIGDLIEGEGEWDPPGDWRRFFVDLQSGTSVGRNHQF